nr:uncharacterized protein LOC123749261 [Procambarus clarkii]
MLAKNINSSDTFASIKFNIYVEVGEEETTTKSQGEGGGGESRTIGGGRESQTVGGKRGGRESQTVGGKGGGRDSLTVGGEEIGRESETAGGERGRESQALGMHIAQLLQARLGESQTVRGEGGEPPTKKIKTGYSYAEQNVPSSTDYDESLNLKYWESF